MATVPPTHPDVLLVPGGFCGPWVYEDVVSNLTDRGLSAAVASLPSVGGGPRGGASGFAEDVAAVRQALDALETPVVLAGHSYGGAVISAAASGPHPKVRELVYLCAAAPGPGESLASTMAAVTPPDMDNPLVTDDQGLTSIPDEAARMALFHDVAEDRASEAIGHLQAQDMSGTDEPIDAPAWTQLPAVYVRGEDDRFPRALAPDFLDRAEEVVDVPTGHVPQWARPDLVADVIARRAGS